MYIYILWGMYACMYIYIVGVCMHVYIYIVGYVCMYIYIVGVCMHVYIYVCICDSLLV